MRHGQRDSCEHLCLLSCFKDEEGYASHVYALAILLSLTLVFSLAASQWLVQKSATIQTVADTAALSASNTVSSYYEVAQIADAVIFSLGITGISCIGIGFVVSCIPFVSGIGVELVDMGVKIVRARNKAAEQLYRVLEQIEKALPFLIGLSAVRIIHAQSHGDLIYHGIAIPYPLTSESTYPENADFEIDNSVVEEAKELADQTEGLKELEIKKKEALSDGWYADCGNPEHSLYERASHLAGLHDLENPYYADPANWTFAAPILRSRNYYQRRLTLENSTYPSIDEMRQSECRKRFYEYAHDQLLHAHYSETEKSLDLFIPKLPESLNDYKASSLYTQKSWPSNGSLLHAYTACPNCTGAISKGSLKNIDDGSLSVCPHCKLTIEDQSLVTRLTSKSETGYEYWYHKVVDAAERYRKASEEYIEKSKALEEGQKDATSLFKEILDDLSLKRVKFIPPGCRGCISLVYREDGARVPSRLSGPFIAGESLPKGFAIAGSAIAPDNSNDSVNTLRGFGSAMFGTSGVGGVAGEVIGIWGDVIEGYGDVSASLTSWIDSALYRVGASESFFATRLKSGLSTVVEQVGLNPVDLKQYKPTLVQAVKILEAEGVINEDIFDLFESIPFSENELLNFSLQEFGLTVADGKLTFFDVEIPFLNRAVSLSLPLGDL